MDISKASNFERFVYDLLGRDGDRVRTLFRHDVEEKGSFIVTPEEFARIERYGFVSAKSSHADRVNTIRETYERFGVMIDPHTADGVKGARDHLEPGVPTIVLETALPIKFAATIVEALGREPTRPEAFEGIESLPKRSVTMPNDVQQVKRYISEHCSAR
jgi:threonine synthase